MKKKPRSIKKRIERRGGPRPGAGRKRLYPEGEGMSRGIYISNDLWKLLGEEAALKGKTRSQLASRILERSLRARLEKMEKKRKREKAA